MVAATVQCPKQEMVPHHGGVPGGQQFNVCREGLPASEGALWLPSSQASPACWTAGRFCPENPSTAPAAQPGCSGDTQAQRSEVRHPSPQTNCRQSSRCPPTPREGLGSTPAPGPGSSTAASPRTWLTAPREADQTVLSRLSFWVPSPLCHHST